jgi:hypothetical protein
VAISLLEPDQDFCTELNQIEKNFSKRYWSYLTRDFGTFQAFGISVSSDIFCATVEMRISVVTVHFDKCLVKCGVLSSISEPPQT